MLKSAQKISEPIQKVQKKYRYHSQKCTKILDAIQKVHKSLEISLSNVHKKALKLS